MRVARYAGAPPRGIIASIGTAAVEDPAEVFLCENPVSGYSAAGSYDQEPCSDQTGPLRGREERCG